MAIGVKIGRFQFQKGTSEEWAKADLILLDGEMAYESDTKKLKVGDGRSKYEDLEYIEIGNISVADLTEEDLAKVTGPKGEPGKDFTYDMFTAEQRLDLKGEPGDSITITKIDKDSQGNILLTFSDGTEVVVPKGDTGDPGPVGPPGPPGKDGSDATVTAGTGLRKSGSTISVNTSYVATKTDLNNYVKSTDIPKIVVLTQSEYDKLSRKDSGTLYFIKE